MGETLTLRFLGIDGVTAAANSAGASIHRLARIADETGMQMGNAHTLQQQRMAQATQQWSQTRLNYARQFGQWEIQNAEYQASQQLRAAETGQKQALTSLANHHEAQRSQFQSQYGYILSGQGNFNAATVANAKNLEQELLNSQHNEMQNAIQHESNKVQNLKASSAAQIGLVKQSAAQRLESEKAYSQQVLAEQQNMFARQNRMAEEAIAKQQAFRQELLGIGGTATLVGTVVIAMGAMVAKGMESAVQASSKFTQQLLLLHTQANATIGEVKFMHDAILGLAGDVGYLPEELAKAAYHLESLGMRGKDAFHVLEVGARGAKVGMADLEATVNNLGTIMASYHMKTQDASKAMAQLDAIVGIGNMTMSDLNAALRSGIVTTAGALGIKFNELGAALATLTDLGQPATQAATRLRTEMIMLAAPTGQGAKILEAMGLSADEAGLKMNTMWANLEDAGVHVTAVGQKIREKGSIIDGLQMMVDQMNKAGLTAIQQEAVFSRAFGGARSAAGILTLVANLDRFRNRLGQINELTDSFGNRVRETYELNPQVLFDRMKAGIESARIELGDALIPAFIRFGNTLLGVITGVREFIAGHKDMIATLLPLFAILAMGTGILMVLGGGFAFAAFTIATLAGSFGIFLGLIAAAIISIGSLIVFGKLMTDNWTGITNIWDTRVVPAAQRIWQTMSDVGGVLAVVAGQILSTIGPSFRELADSASRSGTPLNELLTNVGKVALAIEAAAHSQGFADFLAFMATYFPADIRVAISWINVLLIEIQTAMHMISGVIRAELLFQEGKFGEAAKVLSETASQAETDFKNWTSAVQTAQRDSQYALEEAGRDYQRLRRTFYDSLNGIPTEAERQMDAAANAVQKGGEEIIRRNRLEGAAAGAALGQGMQAGMSAQMSAVYWQAYALAVNAKNGMVDGGIIGSPSVLTREQVGIPLAQGVVEGMERETPQVQRAASAMIQDSFSATPASMRSQGMNSNGTSTSSTETLLSQIHEDLKELISVVTGGQDGNAAPSSRQALEQFIYDMMNNATSRRRLGMRFQTQ